MLYETVLTVHIALGIATGLVASYAAVALWNNTTRTYRATAIGLGFLATLEVLTGTSLSLISPTVTALSVCANILIYLSVVFFFETLLLLRMKAASQPLPLINTISPLASSLLVLLGAVTLGF